MQKTSIKQDFRKENYVSPEVEVVSLSVEKGFNGSLGSGDVEEPNIEDPSFGGDVNEW